jgi:hypothetical protein
MNNLKTLFPLFLVLGVLLSCGLGDKAKQVTQLAKSVEQAQKNLASGDTSGAFGALFGGGEAVQPVDFRKLTDLLPANLPGLERKNAGGEKSSVMGMATSKAEAEYHADGQSSRIDVSINDLGSVRGLGMLGFNWLSLDIDKENDQGYERTLKYEGYPAYEKFERGSDWSRGEMSVFVADRFIVTVDGNGVSNDAIKDALGLVNLDLLEAMRNEGVGEEASTDSPDVSDFISGLSKDEDAEGADDAPETMADFFGDMNDGRNVEPIDFRELQVFLPDEMSGLARANTEGESGGAMGVKTSSATATYQNENDGSTRATIKIFDTGTLGSAVMLGGYSWLMMEMDKESDQGFERTIAYKGHPAYEKFTRTSASSQGTMQAVVGKRFVIEIEGRGVEMDALRAAMDRIDLDKLDSMKDIGVTPES